MRIGEILIEQRKLRPSDLTRALAEKPADKRLGSFLIAKGLVDFDDASRALGEQKGVPCALAKHLAGRDPALAALIPAELGRSSCALPIGKSSKGTVIVCVRDPAPALLAALQHATRADITMVVAPATRLEHLIVDAYGVAPNDEFDIDFSTGMQPNPAAPASSPPPPDMDALDPASVRLALTDLDDARVDKDPTQSGQMSVSGRPSTLPPSTVPSRPATQPPSSKPNRAATQPPTSVPNRAAAQPPLAAPATVRVPQRTTDPRATRPMSVDAMKLGLEHSTSREAATDLVLAYVATRWESGLVLAVRDKTAIGYRGHAVSAPESISITLSAPSTIQRAVESRFVSVERPTGAAQDALLRALGEPGSPAAAPVVVGGQPVAVIAVGDPMQGDIDAAAADLAMLAEALGIAYHRIVAR